MFADRIEVVEGCWLWTGALTADGYGRVKIAQVDGRAHRALYEALVGPIPEGMDLDHLCHNRAESCPGGPSCPHRRCVNPEHLEPVTRGDNQRRSQVAHAGKTHCVNGHPLSGDNVRVERSGQRRCLACAREFQRRYQQRLLSVSR